MSTKRKVKLFGIGIPVLLLCLILMWAGFLYTVGNSNLHKVDALSGAENTPGTTYLIVGSDQRIEGWEDQSTDGQRADTIMVLHKPDSGNTALVSIPRDTLVTYPGLGYEGKINAAFSMGGQQLLVETVEELTGLTIDHYVQIGMDGVEILTDAVGGIRLCLDYDVDDERSQLVWQAGCHEADGQTALAFSRMRYADPLGDIGRTVRQRQVVAALIDKAVSKSTLVNPFKQKELVDAASSVVTVDESDSLMTLARAGLAMRDVMGADGLMGAPPIADMNYYVNGSSHVLLDPNTIDQFWIDLRDGNLTKESFADF